MAVGSGVSVDVGKTIGVRVGVLVNTALTSDFSVSGCGVAVSVGTATVFVGGTGVSSTSFPESQAMETARSPLIAQTAIRCHALLSTTSKAMSFICLITRIMNHKLSVLYKYVHYIHKEHHS